MKISDDSLVQLLHVCDAYPHLAPARAEIIAEMARRVADTVRAELKRDRANLRWVRL